MWLLLVVVMAVLFVPLRQNQLFTTLLQDHSLTGFIRSEFIYPYANFDGVHYLNIAYTGYSNEGRFLPAYPFIIKTLSLPFSVFFGNSITVYFWVAAVFQFLIGFLAVKYLYRLLRLDYSEELSKKTIYFFVAFPTAFFLATHYSEAFFIYLSVISFYFARKRKWLLACMVTAVLSVTRLSGLLMIFPLLVELFLQQKQKIQFNRLAKKVVLFLLIPLPLILYAYFNYIKWGDWLYFVHAHGALGNSRSVAGIVLPFVTVYRYIKIVLTVSPVVYEFWIAVLELLSLLFVSFSLYLGYIKKIRWSYQVYSLVLIVLPIFSGTLSGFPRYILPLFPLFLALAMSLKSRPKLFKWCLFACLLLQAVLFALFVRRYYIS